MYTINNRIRYSEVDSSKELLLSSLLDYFQDCCTFESEELGIGVDYLAKKQAAWVLSSWQIEILRYPQFNETIRISTWPYGFKGFYGYRNFAACEENGAVIAKANSVWVFLDTAKMRPQRISGELVDAYHDAFREPLAGTWAERKITIPKSSDEKEPVPVVGYYIDTNHHMNNSKYIQVAMEYLPDDFKVTGLRAEYKKAAKLGDMICPAVSRENNNVTVLLSDREKNPYAVISFSSEMIRKTAGG